MTPEEEKEISLTGSIFRWAVVPYYLSLIDPENPSDPVRLQSIPSIEEYNDSSGVLDLWLKSLPLPLLLLPGDTQIALLSTLQTSVP